MFDRLIILGNLKNIEKTLSLILDRTKSINDYNDFLSSPSGLIILDAVCMNLIAIGEGIKNLDKLTHSEYLNKYHSIYWPGVMKMRDKIAHHYFEVDAEIVYNTVKESVPELYSTIQQMIIDLKEEK